MDYLQCLPLLYLLSLGITGINCDFMMCSILMLFRTPVQTILLSFWAFWILMTGSMYSIGIVWSWYMWECHYWVREGILSVTFLRVFVNLWYLASVFHILFISCSCVSTQTAAFALPTLERLLFRPKRMRAIRVLILTPTRELAVQ